MYGFFCCNCIMYPTSLRRRNALVAGRSFKTLLQQVTQYAKKVLTRFNDKGKQLNELPCTRAHQYSLSNKLTRAQSVNA